MKFKDYYDLPYAVMLAAKIGDVHPAFDQNGFAAFAKSQNLEEREFSQRQDILARAMAQYLPDDYAAALNILKDVLGPELAKDAGMFTEGWWLWPVGRYVTNRACENFDLSAAFIAELTKRFTGEFAMRPLLEAYPAQALNTAEAWSLDANVHVRRLASECLRIRLPWAKKSFVALEHFERYRRILGNLKHDASKFVQKSVANNLNDLYKEDAAKAQSIIDAWQNDAPSKATLWIIKHAMRNQK